MRRRNRYNNAKKERVIMIASSVFVLAAMTMTGIYVKSTNEKEKNDGYHIDFDSLKEPVEDIEDEYYQVEGEVPGIPSDDALDYAPPLTEADSGGVTIPGLTDGSQALFEDSENIVKESPEDRLQNIVEEAEEVPEDQQTLADEAAMAADAQNEVVSEQPGDVTAPAENVPEGPGEVIPPQVSYSIQAGESLVWPVVGNILINYSMEATVYFSTLQQYKYNPGIVMDAEEGTAISSVASGIVTEVFYNEEIGNGVKVDIGRGYTAIYGQLKELQVSEGSLVSAGTTLGFVAAPTKYYSVEGANAYFALEKDGNPVNPLSVLE